MNIAFFAVALTVLIGFAGLATDSGLVWIYRAELQHSVDAGALAAAQDLPAADVAEPVACDFATVRNAVPEMNGTTATCSGLADVAFPELDDTAVRVTAYRTVQPIFGQILGFPSVDVSASATARIGSLSSTCLFPFFISKETFDDTTLFNQIIFSDTTSTGDAIDVASGSGPNGVRGAMEPGACDADPPKSVVGEVDQGIETKPGDLTQFRQGWDSIADSAIGPSSSCPNVDVSSYLTLNAAGEQELVPGVTPATCPRLIIIPVVQMTASKAGTIVGFVPFYFSRNCNPDNGSTCDDANVGPLEKGDFWGYIVRLELVGLDYTNYQPEFGTKIVALAE